MSVKKTYGKVYWERESFHHHDGMPAWRYTVTPTENELKKTKKLADGSALLEFSPKLYEGDEVVVDFGTLNNLAAQVKNLVLRLKGSGVVTFQRIGEGALQFAE